MTIDESNNPSESDRTGNAALFPPTRWTLISSVRSGDPAARASALTELCHAYWYPIYAYARKRGYRAHDAEDLTQELFARMIDHNSFAAADQNLGRLRSYLLTSASRLFTEEWRKGHALKRGGDQEVISIDRELAEKRFRKEPQSDETPEKFFDRRWALSLLKRVDDRLTEEFRRGQNPERFEALKPFITGETSNIRYAEMASQLNVSESALRTQMNRIRKRFKELVEEEIAHTVADGADIEDELRHLFAALR